MIKKGMKDELGGKIMTEFVTLRAKMYASRKMEGNAARVQFAEDFTPHDYKTCLFDDETVYREQMLFENKKHEVYKVNKHKKARNREDEKRLVQADGITTLARGHVASLA